MVFDEYMIVSVKFSDETLDLLRCKSTLWLFSLTYSTAHLCLITPFYFYNDLNCYCFERLYIQGLRKVRKIGDATITVMGIIYTYLLT